MRFLPILALMLAGCAAGSAVPEISVSVAAIVVETGETMHEADADRPVLPASTAKLVTAIALADGAGLDHRFVTRVCRADDTVTLVGGGDPSLDVEDLLALALAAGPGLRGATGFRYAPARRGGPINPDQPAEAAYNPVLAGLIVAEGAYRAGVTGTRAWTTPAGSPSPAAEGAGWFAHSDPPRQAADLFRHYAHGIGIVLPQPTPGSETCGRELARHSSRPVSALIREMLWTSSNLMAEMLGRFGTVSESPGRWLAGAHPDLTAIDLENFSGLSDRSRVTARSMAQLLAREAARPVGEAPLPAILTPAGWDGGLRNRLTGPPAALAVWAKTGTMHYGVGLAGYALHPRLGLMAIAAYAHDPVLRAAYDPIMATPQAEAAAKAWDRAARQAVDDAVRSLFPEP